MDGTLAWTDGGAILNQYSFIGQTHTPMDTKRTDRQYSSEETA
jgi:hypothetical protein